MQRFKQLGQGFGFQELGHSLAQLPFLLCLIQQVQISPTAG